MVSFPSYCFSWMVIPDRGRSMADSFIFSKLVCKSTSHQIPKICKDRTGKPAKFDGYRIENYCSLKAVFVELYSSQP